MAPPYCRLHDLQHCFLGAGGPATSGLGGYTVSLLASSPEARLCVAISAPRAFILDHKLRGTVYFSRRYVFTSRGEGDSKRPLVRFFVSLLLLWQRRMCGT